MPGDIVLTSPIRPNLKQQVIITAQESVYAAQDACFTHIGIYGGGGQIFDSIPGVGVSSRGFDAFVAGCYFRARRLTGVTPRLQWDICHEAAQFNGNYNYVQALVQGWLVYMQGMSKSQWKQLVLHLAGKASAGKPDGQDALYCSQFVEVVFMNAAKRSAVQGRSLLPLPAAFSDALAFEEVQLNW